MDHDVYHGYQCPRISKTKKSELHDVTQSRFAELLWCNGSMLKELRRHPGDANQHWLARSFGQHSHLSLAPLAGSLGVRAVCVSAQQSHFWSTDCIYTWIGLHSRKVSEKNTRDE